MGARGPVAITVLASLACSGSGVVSAPTPAVSPAAPTSDAASLGRLGYAPGASGVSDASYTRFDPGDTVYVGVDDANLRTAPDAASAVVTSLPLASPVTVVESTGRPVELLERRNEWVRVTAADGATGFVFGAILTPFAGPLTDPMDGQPHGEWAVTFAPDFRPRLRVRPAGRPTQGLDLTPTERFRGGRLEAELGAFGEFESELSVTMCRVDGGAQPACSTAVAREVGSAWAQVTPPDPWRFEAKPLRSCVHGGAVHPAAVTAPEAVRTLRLPSYLRGPDTELECSAVGRLERGPRDGQRLVACLEELGGKIEPVTLGTMWFAEEQAARWSFLPCPSETQPSADALAALAAAGVAVDTDAEAQLPPPFTLPDTLPSSSGTLTRRVHAPDTTIGGTRLTVGELRVGDAVSATWTGALGVALPQGGAMLYQWEPHSTDIQWEAGRGPGAPATYDAALVGCSGSATTFEDLVEVPDEALEVVGRLADGTVVRAVKAEGHAAQDAWLRPYLALANAQYGRPDGLPRGVGQEGLLASVPWVLLDDPWGRRIRLLRHDLQLPASCEPIVYAYADPPARVRIAPAAPIEVWRADPPLVDGAWTGTAQRDGSVVVDGARRRSLFWDGRSVWYPPPPDGWVVRGDEAEAELRTVLPALGLRGREIDEFVAAWVPGLRRAPWVRLAFHDPAVVDEVAPLEIDPPPDVVIRVWMEATPAAGPGPTARPPLPPAPQRQGRVVVEWGGVVR